MHRSPPQIQRGTLAAAPGNRGNATQRTRAARTLPSFGGGAGTRFAIGRDLIRRFALGAFGLALGAGAAARVMQQATTRSSNAARMREVRAVRAAIATRRNDDVYGLLVRYF